MQSDSESLAWLFGPLTAAYLVACGAWLAAHRLRPSWWPDRAPLRTDHKWIDLTFGFVGVALVIGIGQVWRLGWLLPQPQGWVGDLTWQVNNLIIYAPIFIVLAHRRQSTETIYLSARGLVVKLAAGLVLGFLAMAVFLALRGEIERLPAVVAASIGGENLKYALPVFLEGVALAFLFVRLQWALGLWPALVGPGLLFAAAHIPRQIESGLGAAEMVAYFVVTATVAFAALYTMQRSRDVIWIGMVHYLMDIAIKAFE